MNRDAADDAGSGPATGEGVPRGVRRIYETLAGGESEPAGDELSAAARREAPRSFLLLLASYSLTKVGDALANPKTVLPWLMTSLGAPAFLVGFLVPIRESGSLVPQLLIASWVRRVAIRKTVWIAGSLFQGLAIGGVAVVAQRLEGAAAGWSLIALLTLFSLARGLSSVAAKDVLGKTVPKQRRGRVAGWSASVAGLVAILFGTGLLRPDWMAGRGAPVGAAPGSAVLESAKLGWVLATAAGLWWVAALVYAQIREQPGETARDGDAFRQAIGRLALLRDDAPFRRFVVTRALLLCSALTAPFLVVLAREVEGEGSAVLGALVIASGVAGLVSGPVWGRLSDRSSRRVMALAGGLSAAVAASVALATWQAPELASRSGFFALSYFVLAVAHAGVRVGRKTYIVDLARGNQRTDYVSVSNTLIGFALLAVGSLALLTPWIGTAGVVLLLAALGSLGALSATRLPET